MHQLYRLFRSPKIPQPRRILHARRQQHQDGRREIEQPDGHAADERKRADHDGGGDPQPVPAPHHRQRRNQHGKHYGKDDPRAVHL